jgi:hypothetical protein
MAISWPYPQTFDSAGKACQGQTPAYYEFFFIVLSPAGVIIVLCKYENLEHTTCSTQHFNSAINYGLK